MKTFTCEKYRHFTYNVILRFLCLLTLTLKKQKVLQILRVRVALVIQRVLNILSPPCLKGTKSWPTSNQYSTQKMTR